jgi:hypothetical protein
MSARDPDLEAKVVNRLKEMQHGETIDELAHQLKRPHTEILTVLHALRKEKQVALIEGVWKMVID